jgi:catechol-2,3-dioxygenase
MTPTAIFETVLYANDLSAAERFYHDAIGLEVLQRSELLLALRCREGVLLIFDPRKSSVPGRDVPSHGTSGPGHIAFAARPEDLDAWRNRLRRAAVPIEAEFPWPEGGLSLYFRDPAGNIVELAPPTLWGGGWKF